MADSLALFATLLAPLFVALLFTAFLAALFPAFFASVRIGKCRSRNTEDE